MTPPPLSPSALQPFSPSPASAPSPRWSRALGGAWRLTYPRFLTPASLGTYAALLALLALIAAAAARDTRDDAYALWTLQFYLTFLVPALAFVASAGLVRDDMKTDTLDYVLTRPVRRPAYLLHRYLCHNLCLQLRFLPALAVIVAAGVYRKIPDATEIALLLLPAQLPAIAAYGALGYAFGALSGRYLVFGLLYAGIVEVGIGNIPTHLSRLSLNHHLRALANAEHPALSLVALLAATLLFLAVAATAYTLRNPVAKPADA